MAFKICFELRVGKKGMSGFELGRTFGLQRKTAWYFKRKVQEAMKSSEKYPIKGRIEVDEFAIGGKEKGNQDRAKGERKLVIVGLEKSREIRKWEGHMQNA